MRPTYHGYGEIRLAITHEEKLQPAVFVKAGPSLFIGLKEYPRIMRDYYSEGPSNMIDLRSDTITQPTPGMRRAMAEARVGDDVFGDDPTARLLEKRTADLLGKEEGLFMPSGTMANQVAIRTHTQPGDEIVVEANAHIYYYEAGGPAALSGVSCRCLPGERGVFAAAHLKSIIRPMDVHFAPTRLVCVENTHNRGGGSVWPLEMIDEVAAAARDHQLKLHMDGARLWNASVASGISEAEYAKNFDSLSVCFSKGLGAPMGSVLVGSRDFIARAKRFRKQFGGGMRQVGIMAAAALYALDHHRKRLADDHANARLLAESISGIPGLEVNLNSVQTNMVLIKTVSQPAEKVARIFESLGLRMLAVGPHTLRAVTHLHILPEDIVNAVHQMQRSMDKLIRD